MVQLILTGTVKTRKTYRIDLILKNAMYDVYMYQFPILHKTTIMKLEAKLLNSVLFL